MLITIHHDDSPAQKEHAETIAQEMRSYLYILGCRVSILSNLSNIPDFADDNLIRDKISVDIVVAKSREPSSTETDR